MLRSECSCMSMDAMTSSGAFGLVDNILFRTGSRQAAICRMTVSVVVAVASRRVCARQRKRGREAQPLAVDAAQQRRAPRGKRRRRVDHGGGVNAAHRSAVRKLPPPPDLSAGQARGRVRAVGFGVADAAAVPAVPPAARAPLVRRVLPRPRRAHFVLPELPDRRRPGRFRHRQPADLDHARGERDTAGGEDERLRFRAQQVEELYRTARQPPVVPKSRHVSVTELCKGAARRTGRGGRRR